MSRAIVEGEVVDVVDLEIVGPDSKTVEFKLNDGTTIGVHLTIRRASRAVNKFNRMGEPIYIVEMNMDKRIRNVPADVCITPERAMLKNLKGGPEVA